MDWLNPLWVTITAYQREVMTALTSVLRGGPGVQLVVFAMLLGALHAWTPGHGKMALAAFLSGSQTRLARGLGVALTASTMHVVSGAAAFLVLHLLMQKASAITSRGTPGFVTLGYAIIAAAGLLMILQAWRGSASAQHGSYMIAAGIGLLPCPLTVMVLGFALAQGSLASAIVILIALALGIALTIGVVAAGAILLRDALRTLLARWSAQLATAGRALQTACGALVLAFALWGLL